LKNARIEINNCRDYISKKELNEYEYFENDRVDWFKNMSTQALLGELDKLEDLFINS
jgi:hypothetical protein